MNQTQSEIDLEKVTARVQKLLNLAAKNPNEAEAAAATAKAMEMLAAYNLDLSTLEQGGQADGKREDARVRGGMYEYERELWEGIARINFCLYFTLKKVKWIVRAGRDVRSVTFEHKVVGRTVNTASTRVMGQYIQSTIERLCRERFPVNSQFFTREAVAYREGMADAVMSKLRQRRYDQQTEEGARKKREEDAIRRAARAGVSTATSLTISDVIKSEAEANKEFLYDSENGPGAYAKMKAEEAEWMAGWEVRRAAAAKAEEEAEALHAAWAAANPEEAAKEEAQRIAALKKASKSRPRSRSYGRYRAETGREQRAGLNYFHEGVDKGASISIDPQAGGTSKPRALR